MARISVSGTIDKVFPTGSGFSMVETTVSKKNGQTYKAWFNVFTTELAGHNVGNSVTVDGLASAGAFMGTDKEGNPAPKGSISINFATIVTKTTESAPPVQNDDIF